MSNNKLLAKNTFILFIRMTISLVVSLYTSRVVLNALGVEDFGIYGIAGGFIGTIGFVTASLSSATSRFITVEMGKKVHADLQKIFCNAINAHLIMSLVVFIIAETIGLWLLESKLNIPFERHFAAHFVYQMSILTTILGITQVPYNSCIIAHEHISIYAYVEMSNILLKLLIVYALLICDTDKLILYSSLNTLVSVGVILFYRIYCKRRFSECHFSFGIDREIMQRMLVFSGWDFVGNMGVTARTQGIAILINMFFGVVANAATSISGQITGIVMGFSSNILMAVKPQLIKSYSGEDYERTNQLIQYTFLGIFYLISFFAIPIIVEMPYILNLWLGQIPQYTIEITTLTFIFSLISTFAVMMITIPHAAGKNKYPSIVNGLLYLSALPVTYFSFRIKPIIWIPFVYNIITIFGGFLFITWLTSRYLPVFNFRRFVFFSIFKNILIVIAIFLLVTQIQHYLGEASIIRLILVIVISFFLTLGSAYFLALDKTSRNLLKITILQFLKSRFSKEIQ